MPDEVNASRVERAGKMPAVHALPAFDRTAGGTPAVNRPSSLRSHGGRDARGPPPTARPRLRKRTGHTRDATHSATRLELRTASESADPRRARRPRSTGNRETLAAEENRPYARRDAFGNASRTTDGERVGGPSAGETPAVPALPAFDRTAGETPAVHHQPRDACGIPTASARLHPLRRLDAE